MIAIQGIKGSFHSQAVHKYFGKLPDLLECATFDSLVAAVAENKSKQGFMAIENSIAGAILTNYSLLDKFGLSIAGECYMNIEQHLMALETIPIEQLNEIHSHPMALYQCKDFFAQYKSVKLVETEDTAVAARNIRKSNLPFVAAVASEEAATIYELKILKKAIQTIKNNVTRFVLIQTEKLQLHEGINKASIKFILNHQRGSLATVLNILSDCQMNLTKIQSLPIIKTPGKYAFFADIVFDNLENYQKAIALLNIITVEYKIIGVYRRTTKK